MCIKIQFKVKKFTGKSTWGWLSSRTLKTESSLASISLVSTAAMSDFEFTPKIRSISPLIWLTISSELSLEISSLVAKPSFWRLTSSVTAMRRTSSAGSTLTWSFLRPKKSNIILWNYLFLTMFKNREINTIKTKMELIYMIFFALEIILQINLSRESFSCIKK